MTSAAAPVPEESVAWVMLPQRLLSRLLVLLVLLVLLLVLLVVVLLLLTLSTAC